MSIKNWWRHPQVQPLIRSYTGLSEREQKLTALTLMVLLAAVLLMLILWPMLEHNRSLYADIHKASVSNDQLQQRLTALRTEVHPDPDEPVRREITNTENNQALVDERIAALTSALIPPAQMTELLGNVLAGNKNLKPLELTTLAPVRVSLGEGFEEVELYRHALRLRVQATYPALLSYLQALDELPWVISWDELDYQVKNYPSGEFELEVSALSRQQEVLGGR